MVVDDGSEAASDAFCIGNAIVVDTSHVIFSHLVMTSPIGYD